MSAAEPPAPASAALLQLQALQSRFQALESCLLQGDATAFETLLMKGARDLMALAQHRPARAELAQPAEQRMLRDLSLRLMSLREGMARRQAGVERELGLLIPATRSDTYGQRPGIRGYASGRAPLASLRA